jgi:glyoxalase family protein
MKAVFIRKIYDSLPCRDKCKNPSLNSTAALPFRLLKIPMRSAGIHHITAIAGHPQLNLDFYTETLGLRLVKRTVNFDDPGSYHFYFGDNVGNPGTIITFFPWPGARRGTRGTGQVTSVSFAIPRNSMAFWKERLRANHVAAEEIIDRFGNKVLRFLDPDGLMLELIESPVIPSENGSPARTEGSRESYLKGSAAGSLDYARDAESFEHHIRGFAAPTLEVRRIDPTEKLLTEILGFEFVGEENNRRRLRGSGSSASAEFDLVSSDAGFGRVAVGNVHHIAFRAANDEEQLCVREKLLARGLNVTPVIDRQYFHSIYFREPNGILFEIATDGPGFLIDESADELGESLRLPSMYESMRSEIERVLPAIQLQHAAS